MAQHERTKNLTKQIKTAKFFATICEVAKLNCIKVKWNNIHFKALYLNIEITRLVFQDIILNWQHISAFANILFIPMLKKGKKLKTKKIFIYFK